MIMSFTEKLRLLSVRDNLKDYFDRLPIVHTNAIRGIKMYTDINFLDAMLPKKLRYKEETCTALWNRYLLFCEKR